MKTWKKLGALIVSAALIAGLATSCGNQEAGGQSSSSAPQGGSDESVDSYPSKPITLTLGWAAGGGADLTARAIMPYVEQILGQSIVITYNAGAGGELSFVELANDPPDGYNWAWTVTPHLLSFPISRETEYQLEDIMPIANIAYDPGIIAVTEDSPFNTLQDLVDYCKENPGELTFGNGGTGGDDFIGLLLFAKEADIEITQVAYSEGTGSQISALLGGHIDVAAFNASEASQYDGIKLLGVMAEERVSIIEDIPTFIEQGYDVVMSSDRGFSAPAGTPKEIVQKIADAVEQAMQDPGFIEAAENLSILTEFMGPDEYQAYLEDYREDLQAIYDENPW